MKRKVSPSNTFIKQTREELLRELMPGLNALFGWDRIKKMKVIYKKTDAGWVWEFWFEKGILGAVSARAFTHRWSARRSFQLLLEAMKFHQIAEDTSPDDRDYPLTRKPSKPKKPVGGESDLIDKRY